MSVAQIGELHNRYVRLSDQFKAVWTYNQFATGVFKNILQQPLPYKIEFQKHYDEIRAAGDAIQTVGGGDGAARIGACEAAIAPILRQVAAADALVTAGVVRRFFEKLRRSDDKIIFHLIKFYLYAGSVDGEQRDKLDFLFTRIAEDYLEQRGEYYMKDQSELRKLLVGLLSVFKLQHPPDNEGVTQLIRTVRAIREEVVNAKAIEELTSRNLLRSFRELKHKIGELFLVPDILLAIVECNIASKNAFVRLYKNQEDQILEDSRRLLESEAAITAGLGRENPAIAEELERFKRFKEAYDNSREKSDVKHQLITQLKLSMNSLLGQLDRQFASPASQPSDVPIFADAEEVDDIEAVFGPDPLLYPHLQKIYSVLNYFDADVSQDRITRSPEARGLRLETWEIEAFQKLFLGREKSAEENEEMLALFLRGAALRMMVEDQAQEVLGGRRRDDAGFLEEIASTLSRAKEIDIAFGESLNDSPLGLSPKLVHRLYRSRLRLMRAFSGLWLLYDKETSADDRLESFAQ
ncbi:MAG: hypothetical protein HYU52_08975 [Acidobacteria bacterium]|nr:hypothetical protein [Acidobacteriota bacterium]